MSSRPLSIRRALPTLGALGVLGPMGNDIFLPAMPIMAAWFLAPAAAIQFALGAMSIGMALGQLSIGIIADRAGRRRPMIAGVGLATLSAFAASAAPNVTLLVVASFLLGLGAASGMVVGRAVVADIANGPDARRAFAILGSLTGIGPVVGPLLGTVLLAVWGWQATFIALGLMAAGVLVAVLIEIPETLPVANRHTQPVRSYPALMARILATPSYLVNATFIWLGFAMVFGYISASSFIVQAILGWSPGAYSLVFAINGASMAVFGMLTGVWAHRFSARFLLGCAMLLQSMGAALLLINLASGANSPFVILPALWCIAVGMGFVFGPATGNALVDMRGKSGTALAVMGALQFVAGGIAAPLVGIAGETSLLPLTVLVSVCTAVNLTVFFVGRRFTR